MDSINQPKMKIDALVKRKIVGREFLFEAIRLLASDRFSIEMAYDERNDIIHYTIRQQELDIIFLIRHYWLRIQSFVDFAFLGYSASALSKSELGPIHCVLHIEV